MARSNKSAMIQDDSAPKVIPALSPEAKENELINLAMAAAEEQLRNGTASAQVIVHYLKLGTTRERLEKEKLEEENKMLRAKTESIKAQKQAGELFNEAIAAMKRYSGSSEE